MNPERQPVYDALDALPVTTFAALVVAVSGLNRVLAATVLGQSAASTALDAAIDPWRKKLGL